MKKVKERSKNLKRKNFKLSKEFGFYEFLNWFDETAWYPLGRIVGGTVYPGLMITAGAMHWISNLLGFTGMYYIFI